MSRALLLVLAALATALGLANLYSADLGLEGVPGRAFTAQGTHALASLVAFAIASRLPVEALRRHALLLWAVCVGLLLVTHAHGAIAGGARSWLVLGPVRLQPSELFKLALPLALAAELARPTQRRWEGAPVRRALERLGLHPTHAAKVPGAAARIAAIAALIVAPIGLVAIQPDLGGTGLLALCAASMLWISGLPRWLLGGGALAAAGAAPIAWGALEDYQRARVLTFLDPTSDPSGAGYQTLQSLYAIASGGLTGRGFLAGTQGRLGFLPEHTTDFILAHLAEEWGVIGAALCLGLLVAIVATGLVVAEGSRDRFGALLAAGLSLQLFWQVVVNAGGILGLLPLTGVTLPFFSYGGSSLVVSWASVGLLAALARGHARRPRLAIAPRALPRRHRVGSGTLEVA